MLHLYLRNISVASSTGFNFSLSAKPGTKPAIFGGGTTAAAGHSPGFQFSLAKSPSKGQDKFNEPTAAVPASPDADMYVNKEEDETNIHFEPIIPLPEKVEVRIIQYRILYIGLIISPATIQALFVSFVVIPAFKL